MPKHRVEIPKNPKELLDLAEKVYTKHHDDGASSKLLVLDWDVTGPTIALALEKHKKAEELNKLRDEAYQERDALLGKIETSVKGSRDVLTGIFSTEMKKLGEWGFNVFTSTAPNKSKEDKGTV